MQDKTLVEKGDTVVTTEDSKQQMPAAEDAAAAGTRQEVSFTFREAFKCYHRAVFWAVIIGLFTVMESYDLQIVNSFYAFPQFTKRFGVPVKNGYQITSEWQLGISLAAHVGLISGVFLNGWLVDKYGHRKIMMGSLVWLSAAIFLMFFATNIEMIFGAELLCSIPFGLFAAATPTYAAEITPLALRGYLTTYINLCWVMGRFIATGVLTAQIKNPTQWSYKIPMAIQWMWPLPLFIAVYLSPDSPWWLVRMGRPDDAEKVLRRLVTAPEHVVNVKNSVAMMQHTIQTEKDMNIGSSYAECFRGTNRRRTEIAMVSWGCQILPGFAIQNYITYFFTLAGLSAGDSFKLTLGNLSIAFLGTCLSWFLQRRAGRRPIYLWGLVSMAPIMWIVAFLDFAPSSSTMRWVQCSLLLIWFFSYGLTIGPVPYAIAAEVGASNLRAKTISLGRNMYYFLSVINVIVSPYMLNPARGDLKGKAAFPAAAFTIGMILWTFFRLPETKGMTPETLDHLFHEKTPARKFKDEAHRFQ